MNKEKVNVAVALFLVGNLQAEQRLERALHAVVYQVELAVRGYERNRPVVLKSRQPHALVELDVLDLDRLLRRASAVLVEVEEPLVVQSQKQLRHSRQVTLHAQHAFHLGLQHLSGGGDDGISLLLSTFKFKSRDILILTQIQPKIKINTQSFQ